MSNCFLFHVIYLIFNLSFSGAFPIFPCVWPLNEGVSVQAHACHSGDLHDTAGQDLPKLEQVHINLQENNSHLTRTVTLSQLSELQLCINPSISLLFFGGWFDIRP